MKEEKILGLIYASGTIYNLDCYWESCGYMYYLCMIMAGSSNPTYMAKNKVVGDLLSQIVY